MGVGGGGGYFVVRSLSVRSKGEFFLLTML